MTVVRIPTPEQEQKRALGRQRAQLRGQRLSLAARGRMLLLGQGWRQSNQWWQKTQWVKLQPRLPEWLRQALMVFKRLIEAVDVEVRALSRQVEESAPGSLPVGMGKLTHQIIETEIKDWNNFKNRRQVGSYAGLTGGVSASGERHMDLSITKAGNRRLATALVECSWRLLSSQPQYWLAKKWGPRMLGAAPRKRKQIIVAFARQFLIDVWKWKTNRATPESLGWMMA